MKAPTLNANAPNNQATNKITISNSNILLPLFTSLSSAHHALLSVGRGACMPVQAGLVIVFMHKLLFVDSLEQLFELVGQFLKGHAVATLGERKVRHAR
jgi:hypothetical protein